MDTRYSADVVDQLLKSMAEYCQSIQNGARDLNKLLNTSYMWRDSQYERFGMHINEMNQDLEKVLKIQSEYMNILDSKVREMRT